MSQLAIIHPSDLLGQELREELARRATFTGKVKLLSTLDDEIGALTEVRGEAAVVQPYEPDELEGVAVAFFCGPAATSRALLAALPQATTAILLGPDAEASDGQPVVARVSGRHLEQGRVMVSPHPGAVLLTHLLAALAPLGVRQAAATVIQPASLYGKRALDELFEQTRAILNFQGQKPEEIFGRQLAFNLFPPAVEPADLAALVNACLAKPSPLSVAVLQGGIFHGVSVSLSLRLPASVTREAVIAALAHDPLLELDREEPPSPVDAAQSNSILLGSVVEHRSEPGSFSLFAVMDNLTAGGAVNAADIAEMVIGRPVM